MKIFNPYIWGALLCCAAFTACEESDDYKPGEKVADDCIRAYFPSSNKGEFIKSDEDERVVTVTVTREKTAAYVNIPLIVKSKTDNVTIPESVEFKAGESETSFQITYTDLNTTPKFDIALPEEYTDPYTIKEGSIEYAASVFRLTLISNCVTYRPYDTDEVIWQNDTSAIYQMGHENMFIWRNFYCSGRDLKFKVSGTFDTNNVFKTEGDIIPLNHYYHDGVYGWYYTTDEEGTEYESWTPKGQDEEVNWLYFYDPYEGSSYFYIDFSPTVTAKKAYGWGYAWSAVINTSGNYVSNYFFMYYNREDFDDNGNYIAQ